ncbi:hypothetical protein GCM10010978_01110 [Compostibacillus humi]|uniref:Uncharacterized protein n=1 Tax=Compostibacillus humi TaxID=1245525 RepID=A0A8J3EJ07_9BACI|nr:hypothetical protein [Compostibacillus humi]GGH68291.1 hypothetical protein GCM10010978_01110 [Compostibacillus humi]HLT57076.1 hypothetical protein [Bacillota bacterium]
MVRGFIILLFMVIFFLAGAVYGMKETKGVEEKPITEDTPVSVIVEEGENAVQEDPLQEEDIEELLPTEPTLAEKTASALEAGVQGFYELVVNILYGIAALFF